MMSAEWTAAAPGSGPHAPVQQARPIHVKVKNEIGRSLLFGCPHAHVDSPAAIRRSGDVGFPLVGIAGRHHESDVVPKPPSPCRLIRVREPVRERTYTAKRFLVVVHQGMYDALDELAFRIRQEFESAFLSIIGFACPGLAALMKHRKGTVCARNNEVRPASHGRSTRGASPVDRMARLVGGHEHRVPVLEWYVERAGPRMGRERPRNDR
jgi:hypothetical protein